MCVCMETSGTSGRNIKMSNESYKVFFAGPGGRSQGRSDRLAGEGSRVEGAVTLSSGFDPEGGEMWKPSFKQQDVTRDAK